MDTVINYNMLRLEASQTGSRILWDQMSAPGVYRCSFQTTAILCLSIGPGISRCAKWNISDHYKWDRRLAILATHDLGGVVPWETRLDENPVPSRGIKSRVFFSLSLSSLTCSISARDEWGKGFILFFLAVDWIKKQGSIQPPRKDKVAAVLKLCVPTQLGVAEGAMGSHIADHTTVYNVYLPFNYKIYIVFYETCIVIRLCSQIHIITFRSQFAYAMSTAVLPICWICFSFSFFVQLLNN